MKPKHTSVRSDRMGVCFFIPPCYRLTSLYFAWKRPQTLSTVSISPYIP